MKPWVGDLIMNKAANAERKILFFSNNKDLADSLSTEIQNIKLNSEAKLSFISEPLHINSDADSDIIIYDLDLVNSDLKKVSKDISIIKTLSSNKLLFLIGEKEELALAKENKDINLLVTRYLRTQVASKQLILAIENDANKISYNSAQHKYVANKRSLTLKRLGILAIIILFITILIVLALKFSTKQEANNRTVTALSELEQPRSPTPTSAITNDELTQKGINARVQGNIYEPLNDNALFYFKQALVKDSFNNVAYTNQQEILEAMRQGFPTLIKNQEFKQAQVVLNSLSEYQAFHQDNLEMQQSLNQATDTNNQSASVKRNAPTIVADKVNKPELAKIRTTTNKQADVTLSNSTNATKTIIEPIKAITNAKPAPIVNQKPEINKVVTKANEINILPPKLIKRIEANYPRRAYNLDIEGWVELEFQVNNAGKPFDIKISDEQPAKFFSKAAVEALEKWTFSPARDVASGVPVTSEVTSTKFNFALGK